MAMIAMTTSNSISVNAEENILVLFIFIIFNIVANGREKSQVPQNKSITIFLTIFRGAFPALTYLSGNCGAKFRKSSKIFHGDTEPWLQQPSRRRRQSDLLATD
jgi:hypothetical protein